MMKKIVLVLIWFVLLSGCATSQTFEQVTDEPVQTVKPQCREVYFQLAEEPALPAMEADGGKIYLCGDYDVMLQTRDAGDLNATVREVSGFSKENLTLIQTASGEIDRYEFVWSCSTEEGALIGRGTILDDGNYHYVLSSTVSAAKIEEYQEIWNGIFESFKLV